MANDQRRLTGCRPIIQPFGALRTQMFKVTTGSAIYLYQPLTLDSNGQVAVMTSAANQVFCGVPIGFLDTNRASIPSGVTTTTSAPNFPATGTDGYALVTVDPNQLYFMEEGTGGTALAATDIGTSVTFEEVSLGNTTTGISNIVIQQSALGTSTQGCFQLLEVMDSVNSDGTANAAGSGCKWVVKPVRHQFSYGLGSGALI